MNSIDYTPVLLAQITDLAMRVTQLEATNAALKAEVERLTGHSLAVKSVSSVKTSVPLTPTMHSTNFASASPSAAASSAVHSRRPPSTSFAPSSNRPPMHVQGIARREPRSAVPIAPPRNDDYQPLTIQDILHLNEEVTIQVGLNKDEQGNFIQTTCVTQFDGVHLVVKQCELAPSLIGLSSTKPGEILYKFIEELKSGDHIKKTFTTAPWKLCFVERDGKRLSLEDLRRPTH
jgi:hypothetical protein